MELLLKFVSSLICLLCKVFFKINLFLVVKHAIPTEGMRQFESSFKTIDATNFQPIGNTM